MDGSPSCPCPWKRVVGGKLLGDGPARIGPGAELGWEEGLGGRAACGSPDSAGEGRGQCLGVSQLLPEAPQSLPQPGVREPSPQAPPVGGTQGPGDSLVLGWAVPSGRRARSSPQSVSVSPTLSRRRGVWGRYRSGPAGLRTPAGGWAGGLWKGPRFSAQGPETSPRPPGWGSDLCPQRPHPGLPASSPLCPVVCPAALEAVHTRRAWPPSGWTRTGPTKTTVCRRAEGPGQWAPGLDSETRQRERTREGWCESTRLGPRQEGSRGQGRPWVWASGPWRGGPWSPPLPPPET